MADSPIKDADKLRQDAHEFVTGNRLTALRILQEDYQAIAAKGNDYLKQVNAACEKNSHTLWGFFPSLDRLPTCKIVPDGSGVTFQRLVPLYPSDYSITLKFNDGIATAVARDADQRVYSLDYSPGKIRTLTGAEESLVQGLAEAIHKEDVGAIKKLLQSNNYSAEAPEMAEQISNHVNRELSRWYNRPNTNTTSDKHAVIFETNKKNWHIRIMEIEGEGERETMLYETDPVPIRK